MDQIKLTITSIIHSAELAEPQVIKQEANAGLMQEGDEWQISYIEEADNQRSKVRLFAFSDELIVIRQGPISYQQVYQPNGTTTCHMITPSGSMDIEVTTYDYQRDLQKIHCHFSLTQSDISLGEFRLELTW